MKRVIRMNVWETNSSMTHALIILPQEVYNRWSKGDLFYYEWKYWDSFGELPEDQRPKNKTVYTREEVLNFLKLKNPDLPEYDEDEDYTFDNYLMEWGGEDFMSYDYFAEDEYCEFGETEYTTPGGEEIVAVYKYGRDG